MKQESLFLEESQGQKLNLKKLFSLAKQKNAKCVSLFSSAGIGELGVEASGIEVITANELIPYRVETYKENFGDHFIIEGDIWKNKEDIIESSKDNLGKDELFLLYATPPCQGMSSNGMGKLKSEIEQGRRIQEDERNKLIIPTLDVIKSLKPKWVLLENVPGMRNTAITTDAGELENIIEYIQKRLGDEYEGRAEIVACHDYGIPQQRKRLITIFTRDKKGIEYFRKNKNSFFSDSMKEPIQTLRDAISGLPSLEAVEGKNSRMDFHPFHYVPIMNPKKLFWVKNTKEGDTAFNNQCINALCGYQFTPGHRDIQVDGKWVSCKNIPITCEKCGEPLPRPTVIDKKTGKERLLKGFHSAYRRMPWDQPARTLTQNFIYEASDNKIHPEENRVLSVYEAMILQTIDRYEYKFIANGEMLSTAKIAEVIGESVPPYLIEKICRMMIKVSYENQS